MSAAPTNTPSQPSAGPVRPCPICGKPAVPRYRPFCSKRCADIDLGRWLGEIYRIPAEENDADEPPSDDSAESTGR